MGIAEICDQNSHAAPVPVAPLRINMGFSSDTAQSATEVSDISLTGDHHVNAQRTCVCVSLCNTTSRQWKENIAVLHR